MKKTILFALLLSSATLFAQKKTTTSGNINFDATTSTDALPKAENKAVVASLDPKTGKLAFEAIIKSFEFSNPRIQDHFNGKGWMDSEKFPTATFEGTITNLSTINFSKDGTYEAEVEGTLTLHGETKKIKLPAVITVNGKSLHAVAEITIKLEDFKVDGPAIAAGKVAKEPKITIDVNFK